MFAEEFENLRRARPIVHCITNYVTATDCANALLACGASPVMADDPCEAEEVTQRCGALCINIGTLSQSRLDAMLRSGTAANRLSIPVVLDPVGAGMSQMRKSALSSLMAEVKFAAIRGNLSEIKVVASGTGGSRGVDTDDAQSGAHPSADAAAMVKKLSASTESVIAVTGASDIVSDKNKTYVIGNGVPEMSRVTGAGCMLSSLVAAFCAANHGHWLEASAAAVSMFGLCGELARARELASGGGAGLFHVYLLDELSLMTVEKLEEGAKVEII